MIEENPIPALVARYRKLKRQVAAVDKELGKVKQELALAVEAEDGQKWMDDNGYAKLVSRKPSVSFNSNAIDRLAQTWADSDDAIMQSCGQMLLSVRKVSDGYTYLQVK